MAVDAQSKGQEAELCPLSLNFPLSMNQNTSQIEIVSSASQGRYVVAARDLRPGETVLETHGMQIRTIYSSVYLEV